MELRMQQKPNIIFIMTDQQRFDTIAALGASWMKTPRLDRLAKSGVSFLNCFVTSPVCVAARASLFTGMYPHSTGVFSNFRPWRPTWVQWLATAGYHCVNIGKMHINPYDDLGGFHQRFVVENKDRPLFLEEGDRAFYDEWDKALMGRGLVKPSRYNRFDDDPDHYREALGCFTWELDDTMHPDVFVGDTANWWIENRKSEAPLFLQIGFPGPHPPYDPIKRYLDQYADVDIPIPSILKEYRGQPSAQAKLRQNMIDFNFDSVAWRKDISPDDLLRLRRHYAANVTMIDEKVGQILDALDKRGYLENAIVMFASDHGDALGDHGHIQKWTMYDGVTRVPLIISGKNIPKGLQTDALVQLMDVAPTILEYAGVKIPTNWEAKSLKPILESSQAGRSIVYAELGRDHIQNASEYIVMRRDRRWKLVWYLGEDEGELYDLENDAGEGNNLWDSSQHRALREQLVSETKDWSIRGMLKAKDEVLRKPQAAMSIKK
jgi:arylsulfatase